MSTSLCQKITKIKIKETTGIYQIRNLKNGKIYVGSASLAFYDRWEVHKSQLKNNKHHSKHLQRSWNKNEEINFVFEILEEVPMFENETKLEFKERLVKGREQYYLDTLMPWDRNIGYNIHKKADSCAGIKMSNEARAKMSKSHTGKKHSEETKNKLSIINSLKKLSQAHKNKLSIIKKLNPTGNASKIGAENVLSKSILQFSLNGEFIKEFSNALELKKIGYNQSNISGCCNNKRHTANGYIWKFKKAA